MAHVRGYFTQCGMNPEPVVEVNPPSDACPGFRAGLKGIQVYIFGALRQGKRNTYKTEQDNALQRHWLGRFRRRTQIVTRSLEMLKMSIALFARFRVNGHINELPLLLR